MNDEIISQICIIRGRKVMLDSDLAGIYGVTTARMNQQVRRNRERFPEDFMFELTVAEYQNLILQFATSSLQRSDNEGKTRLMPQMATTGWGGRRKLPFVFTEHGALMLASVLNSQIAIQASIYVVRAFVKLRNILSMHKELSEKIDDLEKRAFEKLDEHTGQLILVFQAIQELVEKKDDPLPPVGFKYGTKE